jgi:hypothetical protein
MRPVGETSCGRTSALNICFYETTLATICNCLKISGKHVMGTALLFFKRFNIFEVKTSLGAPHTFYSRAVN